MQSVWQSDFSLKSYESASGKIFRDVVIVGGGIAGILTAYLLKEKGVNATIIEAGKVLNGVTANTTAKITCQQELIYSDLTKMYSFERAKSYYNALNSGIDMYKNIVKKNNIACDFQEKPAYLYSTSGMKLLNNEMNFYSKVGANIKYERSTELPIKISGAIKLDGQYQFNPLSFLKSLITNIEIFENTRAIKIDTKNNIIYTESAQIMAQKIVIATHFPIIDTKGFYFLKMYQSRSYLCALSGAQKIDGMYLDINPSGYTFRRYRDYLIFGGLDHRTGRNETRNSFDELNKASKLLFTGSEVKYVWSAQDCMTFDGIPYAGNYSKSTPNIFVLTGFNKWGMVNAMVSADIVSDKIIGNINEYAEIFAPSRCAACKNIKDFFINTGVNIKGLVSQPLLPPLKTSKSLLVGSGDVVWHRGKKHAVYKDYSGKLFVLKSGCTHLNCQIKWNNTDKMWECPCHGSRFDKYGNAKIVSPFGFTMRTFSSF